MGDEKSPKWGWIYYGATLCAGTISSIATKAMSKKAAPVPMNGGMFVDYFQHPYMLTFGMFLSEFLCLPIFYINQLFARKKRSGGKRINPFLCAIPAFCDALASALTYNAYNLAAVSIVQMLTGIRILFTAILSRIFLKSKLYVHHIVGLIIIILGLILVGLALYLSKDANSSFLGIFFLIIAYCITPIQIVIEEAMFKSYTLHPLEIIGYEASAGCFISSLMLIIFQFIPCTRVRQEGEYDTYPQTAHCPYNRMEESNVGLYQLANSMPLLGIMIIVIITLCIFNFASQGITKHLSGNTKATVSVIQTAIVWVIGLIIGWENFLVLQLIGFIVGTIGVIIYNEIYVPPIWGFDYNTKENIAKREENEADTKGKTS
eukprot:TRINITY_DN4015_c0_g3_i7.p2 TRINITY_DN4015_c0_g3~~TRINITY_DN4015_c0_g3_i7.p2  ORF type:complete len:376 (-),score=87.61 TRINITY_DN4015_c0_g3_i7:968-2095(-)